MTKLEIIGKRLSNDLKISQLEREINSLTEQYLNYLDQLERSNNDNKDIILTNLCNEVLDYIETRQNMIKKLKKNNKKLDYLYFK